MKWLAALICSLILLSGGWIRWQFAVNDPLWVDELHTSWVLSGRWSEVANRAIAGNQSPLYFWCCYPVVQILGQSPLSLRLVSLIAGCLLLPFGTWIVWRRTGSMLAAVTAAAGLALESHLIFYSSEARPYALVQLGGLVLAVCVFNRIIKNDAGPVWVAILLAGLIVLLHPTAILLTSALALLLFLARCNPQPWDGWGIMLASAIGILLNPATSLWLGRRQLWTELVDFSQILGTGTAMLFAAWVIPAVLRRWMRGRVQARPRKHEPVFAIEFAKLQISHPAWFWLGFFVLPFAVAAVSSWLKLSGIATPRYLAAIWSFPAIGLGLMVFDLTWRRGLAVAALGLFLLGFGGVPWRTDQGWELIRANPLLVSLVKERSLVGLRNEGWRDIHQQLLAMSAASKPTIWLYANLIEDELLDQQPADLKIRDYLRFPLQGIYSVAGERLEPRAFRAARLIHASDLKMLREREVLVVVRCAEGDLEPLEEAWQRDWESAANPSGQLQVSRIFTAGDLHLLSLQGAAEPRRAEQSN